MSCSNWRSKLALGGIALTVAFSVQAKEPKWVRVECPSANEQAASSTNGDTTQRECWARPLAIIETPEQAAYAKERESRSDIHEASDLKAQQEAAEAARIAAASAKRQEIPAWAQVWIAFFGTLLAFYALWNTTRSDKRNRETTHAQLRAHVFIDKAQIVFTSPSEGKAIAHLDVEYKNFGQTPAYKVRMVTNFYLLDWPVTEALDCGAIPEGGDVLGPGSSRGTRLDEEISQEDAHILRQAKLGDETPKALFVYGRIEYFDAFKIAHFTNFQLFLGGNAPSTFNRAYLQNGKAQDLYGLHSHQHGNEAD